MRASAIRRLGQVVALGVALALSAGTAFAACEQAKVDVGGYGLWIDVAGQGAPTVVFEAGGGDYSSTWDDIPAKIRALGVRTVVYDRAGLGQSDLAPGPYRIDNEAGALEKVLDACGINGPIVLVAHSYGGFVSTLVATQDKRVKGMVLVDANLVDYFDDAEAARILAQFRPRYAGLEKAEPRLAKVLIPIMEATSDTARRLRAAPLAADLPVIDIVAERSWAATPEEQAAMRRVHAAFVAASPAREAVFAAGSSHAVMRDKPQVVIDAVARMVAKVRAAKP